MSTFNWLFFELFFRKIYQVYCLHPYKNRMDLVTFNKQQKIVYKNKWKNRVLKKSPGPCGFYSREYSSFNKVLVKAMVNSWVFGNNFLFGCSFLFNCKVLTDKKGVLTHLFCRLSTTRHFLVKLWMKIINCIENALIKVSLLKLLISKISCGNVWHIKGLYIFYDIKLIYCVYSKIIL